MRAWDLSSIVRAHRHRALSTVRSARTHPYVRRRIATSSGLCEPIAGMIGDDLVRSLMSPHTTAARVLFCFGRRVISGSRPLASSRCVGVRGERWRRPSCTCMHAAGGRGPARARPRARNCDGTVPLGLACMHACAISLRTGVHL